MMLKRLLLLSLAFALFSSGIIGPGPAPAHAAPPTDFQTTQVIGSGLFNPTGLGIAPDGRIFITEQAGKVLIYKNNQLLSQPFTILLADIDAIRTFYQTTSDSFYIPNYFAC